MRESWHIFIWNGSVVQGSLSDHLHVSNTPDTSGVNLNIKNNLFLVLSSVENLQKLTLEEFC